MNNNRYQQFFLAFRIWILAVAFNTILGTVYLESKFNYGPLLLFYGTWIGGIVSLPVLLLLFILINRCIVKKLKGATIFRIVLATAVFFATIAWLLYMEFYRFRGEGISFLLIAIVAGVAATATQYKSFLRLANYTEPFEEIQL